MHDPGHTGRQHQLRRRHARDTKFQVTQATQTITFGALLKQVYGSGTFTGQRHRSSGLAVSFASTTTAVCTVSGATVTLVAAGHLLNPGDAGRQRQLHRRNARNRSFQVTPESQTITFGALANQAFGTAPFTVSANASQVWR